MRKPYEHPRKLLQVCEHAGARGNDRQGLRHLLGEGLINPRNQHYESNLLEMWGPRISLLENYCRDFDVQAFSLSKVSVPPA